MKQALVLFILLLTVSLAGCFEQKHRVVEQNPDGTVVVLDAVCAADMMRKYPGVPQAVYACYQTWYSKDGMTWIKVKDQIVVIRDENGELDTTTVTYEQLAETIEYDGETYYYFPDQHIESGESGGEELCDDDAGEVNDEGCYCP